MVQHPAVDIPEQLVTSAAGSVDIYQDNKTTAVSLAVQYSPIQSSDENAPRQLSFAAKQKKVVTGLQPSVDHTWPVLAVLGMKKLADGGAPALPSDGPPGRKNAGCRGIHQYGSAKGIRIC